MKKFFFSLFLNIVIFIAVSNVFDGFSLPTDFMYLLGSLLILSFAVMLHRPVLKFLTVKINFLTYLLTVFLLVGGALYALELFVPSLYINSSAFKEVNLQVITINAFKVSQIGTLLGVAFVSSFVSALLESLKRSSDD
ncbi:phage holin family protein [Candidatus Dojkabacteria bacterium]|nr:phage holin family protein [Candidatus Dojkabacteria bacterium]